MIESARIRDGGGSSASGRSSRHVVRIRHSSPRPCTRDAAPSPWRAVDGVPLEGTSCSSWTGSDRPRPTAANGPPSSTRTTALPRRPARFRVGTAGGASREPIAGPGAPCRRPRAPRPPRAGFIQVRCRRFDAQGVGQGHRADDPSREHDRREAEATDDPKEQGSVGGPHGNHRLGVVDWLPRHAPPW